MTESIALTAQRNTARLAGFGYLVIIISGIFAEFFVRSRLIVSGDAAATAINIISSGGLYRAGIAGDLIMLVCDVAVAVALYILLKPINKNLALLAMSFRLVHTAICAVNLVNLVYPLLILRSGEYPAGSGTSELQAQALQFLNAHSYGYLIGLIFFGFHCIVLGYLVYKSGFLPKILGIFLYFAAGGYLIDSFANFLLSNYSDYESIFLLIVAVPAIIAELSFCLWLIFKGVRIRS